MDLLKTISLKGFKSIKNLDRLELAAINVLIGSNGSGKSNFISFFHLLNHAMMEGPQAYLRTHGFADSFLHLGSKASPRIRGEVEFTGEKGANRYCFALSPAAEDVLVFSEETISCHPMGESRPVEFILEPGGKESALPKASVTPLNILLRYDRHSEEEIERILRCMDRM